MLCAWYLFSASVGLKRLAYGKNAVELVIVFFFSDAAFRRRRGAGSIVDGIAAAGSRERMGIPGNLGV